MRRAPSSPAPRPKTWFYISVALATLLIVSGLLSLRWMKPASPPDPASAGQYSTPAPDLTLAPDFALLTLDGQTVRLTDYRGQVVLLNTWATWCPPCREEMPDLEAYYRQHRQDGFIVLAVNSQESPDSVASFLAEQDFTFPVLLDPDGLVMQRYRVYGLPTSFFIDRQGMLRSVWSGRLSPARLKEIVDPLL